MWKKFLGKKRVGDTKLAFYYITRRERRIYGIFILFLRENEGGNEVDWEWIDGVTKSQREAEQIGMQCMEYLVTPISMAESMDEIMEKRGFFGKQNFCVANESFVRYNQTK